MKYIIFLLFCAWAAYAQANDSIAEPALCGHLEEVIVTGLTGNTRLKESPSPIHYISNKALRVHTSTNIIDAIAREPGLSQLTTGSGISKPIIRGLGYNRVLVLNDGIRQEGQQWGDEHGIEIDPQSVHSAEVLMGPASLLYGSDAMAGVLILHDAPIQPEGGVYAEAGTEYQTNNGLIDYTLACRGNQKGFVWSARWSQKWAHDYQAPQDGYVPNTRFRERAFKALIGVQKQWGFSHLKLSYYHLTPGITEVEDELPTPSRSYAIMAPFQQIGHYKAVLDNAFNLPQGQLKILLGYQINRRQEYESIDEYGLDFRLHTLSYNLRYVSPSWKGWKTNFGIMGLYQRSENLGTEFLIPAYSLNDIGAYATVSKSFLNCLHLSGGLRYDHRFLHSEALIEEGEQRFVAFNRHFGSVSGSIGLIYNVIPNLDIKANISHGFRAPNMSELGSNGEHEGTFRYELGNQDLKAEHSWQFDLGLQFSSQYVAFSLSGFTNLVGNYIYLACIAPSTSPAEPSVYQFQAGDARLMGGEAQLKFHFVKGLHWSNTFSYVDARLVGESAKAFDKPYLPFTPEPRLLSTLHYDIPLRSTIVQNLFAEVEGDLHLAQNHVMTANQTETATPMYALMNLAFGIDFHLRSGKRIASLGFTVTNVIDTPYQSHLSRLKYADTFALTGRNGFNNMGRNFAFRLLFPLQF